MGNTGEKWVAVMKMEFLFKNGSYWPLVNKIYLKLIMIWTFLFEFSMFFSVSNGIYLSFAIYLLHHFFFYSCLPGFSLELNYGNKKIKKKKPSTNQPTKLPHQIKRKKKSPNKQPPAFKNAQQKVPKETTPPKKPNQKKKTKKNPNQTKNNNHEKNPSTAQLCRLPSFFSFLLGMLVLM